MLLRHLCFLVLPLLAILPSREAHAFRFGTDETIHRIEDVKLKGAEDEALYLGYMTRIPNFLLGVYVEDAGYVLGVREKTGRFYPMPKGEELASFQRNGFLPNPLPTYRIGTLDYIMGYSLWWALALTLAFLWYGNWRKRRTGALPIPAAGLDPAPAGAASPAAPFDGTAPARPPT